MNTTRFLSPLFAISFLLSGCALFTTTNIKDCPSPYIEIPVELQSNKALETFIESVKPQFAHKKIFLDPGHGGEDRKNKGRNKLVTEADINLFTALALRDFLTAAGAEVIMSRSTDVSVALGYRSVLANNSCADIFISVHHNAPGGDKDNWTNYTSTYYHALETDYEYEPMERDMAKFVQRDLSYAMRNPGGLGSFDGTYSDYIIYPKSGFSVLRHTNIPSILVECSFFTHTIEEQKLAKREYNRIEAFGIFRGLSRYLKNEFPVISTKNTMCSGNTISFSFDILSNYKIVTNTIKVFVDKKPYTDFTFANGELNLSLSDVFNKPVTIKILAQNERGNFSAPFEKTYNFLKPKKE